MCQASSEKCLVASGILLWVMSLVMIASGTLTIIWCEATYHLNLGVPTGGTVFLGSLVVVLVGCCPGPTALCIAVFFNLLILLASAAGAGSGGFGIYCDTNISAKNEAIEACSVFGNLIPKCKGSKSPKDLHLINSKGLILQYVLLSVSLFSFLVTIIAICISCKARNRLKGEAADRTRNAYNRGSQAFPSVPPPTQSSNAPQGVAPQWQQEANQGSQSSKAPPPLYYPTDGFNISNINTASATTGDKPESGSSRDTLSSGEKKKKKKGGRSSRKGSSRKGSSRKGSSRKGSSRKGSSRKGSSRKGSSRKGSSRKGSSRGDSSASSNDSSSKDVSSRGSVDETSRSENSESSRVHIPPAAAPMYGAPPDSAPYPQQTKLPDTYGFKPEAPSDPGSIGFKPQASVSEYSTGPLYPSGNAPYPTAGSAPYPTGSARNPAGSAPYPAGSAPYPAGSAPYPAATAPYPEPSAPYPSGNTSAPYPSSNSAYPF